MTKKERVIKSIKGEAVDYIPCGFSLHFPKERATGDLGVKSHFDFFKETDTDILKIMNENLVPSYGKIANVDDYFKLIPQTSIKTDFIQEQIKFSKQILEYSDKDAFTLGTLHGICASGIHPLEKSGMPYEKARELQVSMLRENENKALEAMQRITDGMCALATAYIKEVGLDGVYYAALGAETYYFTDEEFDKWIKPMDLQIIKAIKDAGGYCFLHICKDGLNMDRYKDYVEYVDAVNWGVYEVPFSIEEGKKLFKGKTIMGGLKNRSGVLVNGTDDEIVAEINKIKANYSSEPFILGADCTLATEQDLHKLLVAISALRL